MVSDLGNNFTRQSTMPSSLKDLWTDFASKEFVTEHMIVEIANNLWYTFGSYEVIRGLIPNTDICAIFDISADAVIVEVSEKDYNSARVALDQAYPRLPDVTLCIGGNNAEDNL